MSDDSNDPGDVHPGDVDRADVDRDDVDRDDSHPGEPSFVQPVGPSDPESVTDAQLEAYDLDGDGEISLVENERARLGIIDARLAQMAERGGITGAIAKMIHRIIDRFDND